jgi:hypothetical protein
MQFGSLHADVLSVEDVISTADLDGQVAAVHGVLYRGKDCLEDEYLLLPKYGLFDGIDIGEIKVERLRVLAIDEPNLSRHLVGVQQGACGAWTTKIDSIVIGQIQKRRFLEYNAFVTNIWMMVLQFVSPLSETVNYRRISAINFPQERTPSMPCDGIHYESTKLASVDLMPFPSVESQGL